MQDLQQLRQIVDKHLVADKVTHIQAERLLESIEKQLKEKLNATSGK